MSKKKRLLIAFIVLIGLGVYAANLKSKAPTTDKPTTDAVELPVEYTVWAATNENGEVFGTILATNGATITTSVWWVVESLNCQPGKEVKKGDVIANFAPSEDLQTENLRIQQNYLSQQVGVYNDSLQSALHNVDIQIQTLYDQKATNENQLALLKQNLENAKKWKELSVWDNTIQLSSLTTQLANLQSQQEADTLKLTDALKNQASSAQTTALWALSLVDNTFWITDPQKIILKDPFIWWKDLQNKDIVISDFTKVKWLIAGLTSATGTKTSNDLQTIAEYFSLVAKVISNSIADSRYLPQTQIDSLFTTFNWTAQWVIQAKSNYDSTYAGNTTVRATYNTQITALQNQILSLSWNKTELTNISNDTQINLLQSQINTLQLTIASFDNQLGSLQNSKSIQTQQTNWQLLGVEQNLKILENNLGGEVLYTPIDWVVKTVSAIVGNKFGANVSICTIWPKTVESLKAQFFSTRELTVWQDIFIYDSATLLGTWTIDYQTESVDPQTQNKWYEVLNLQGTWYEEWQKVSIHFDSAPVWNDIRIPLPYLKPKLEWYYATKKWWEEVKVEVGDINWDMIKVVRGLTKGDVIIK